MPNQHKPYNPNTKYGRKKLREQSEIYRQNLSPEDRSNFDFNKNVLLIIIVAVILGALYLIGGKEAAFQWMRR